MPVAALESGVLAFGGTIDPPSEMTGVQNRVALVVDNLELRAPCRVGRLRRGLFFFLGKHLYWGVSIRKLAWIWPVHIPPAAPWYDFRLRRL